MQRTSKRKRNKEFIYELQDIPEGEVEDTTEGNNVDVEDDVALQAETRSGTSTGDSTNIGDPMMPKNPGGEAEVSEAQSRTTAKTTTIQQKYFPRHAKPTRHPEENSGEDDVIESVTKINNNLSRPDEAEGIGGSCVKEIVAHNWRIGVAHFKVEWESGDTTWEHLRDMREDYPRMTSQYIVGNKVSR